MSDSYSEVSYQSPFARIAESFKGVIVGLLFCVLAPVGLWFNEKNAVDTAAALHEGAAKVESVPATNRDSSGTPKLIHVTGMAVTPDTLTDPDFGVNANALKLERKVEMYQWKEEKHSKSTDTVSGSKKTETKYEYKKVWDDEEIKSEDFKIKEGHRNPPMSLRSIELIAGDVKLGEFKVNQELVKMIDKSTPLAVTVEMTRSIPPQLQEKYKPANGQLQSGNLSSPVIGDLRVAFHVTNQQEISIVANSANNEFSQYKASNGKSFWLLEEGVVDAPVMFQNAQDMNAMLTWIFRLLGFIVMWIGVSLVVSPISEIARSVPLFGMLLGGAVGAGVGFFAFVVAAFATSVVIAIAWFAARPLLSIGLMVGVLALIFAARKLRGGRAPANG